MTRKTVLVAVVAMLALGTPAAFALGTAPNATNDAPMAQETTTAPGQETTTAAGGQTANVTFRDQTSNGTAVVVQEVFVPEGGFVVIHEAQQSAGETTPGAATATGAQTTTVPAVETTTTAPGEAQTQQYAAGAVLGNSTYLTPGVHRNVTVTLNRSLEESQVLIAMPHRDTNDNQQYDFPQADDPYVQNGQPVTDWASVTVQATGAGNATATPAGETTTA